MLDGPTRDLNLMARHGRSTLRAVRADVPWDEPFAWRGLYAAVAGRWHDGVGSHAVDAGTLLWVDGSTRGRATSTSAGAHAAAPPRAWRFAPARRRAANAAEPAMRSAWWLGYTPDPDSPR